MGVAQIDPGCYQKYSLAGGSRAQGIIPFVGVSLLSVSKGQSNGIRTFIYYELTLLEIVSYKCLVKYSRGLLTRI